MLLDVNGYTTSAVKNYWLNPNNPYKGVNTTVVSPSGQSLEVQYHTPESFKLKNGRLHELYEKQRVIQDSESKEYIRLNNEMMELSEALTIPDKIDEVKNR